MTKITTDFVGTESAAITKLRFTEILDFWGYAPNDYATWGDARTDLNALLSGTSIGTIGASELAGVFLPKINALNDPTQLIVDMSFGDTSIGAILLAAPETCFTDISATTQAGPGDEVELWASALEPFSVGDNLYPSGTVEGNSPAFWNGNVNATVSGDTVTRSGSSGAWGVSRDSGWTQVIRIFKIRLTNVTASDVGVRFGSGAGTDISGNIANGRTFIGVMPADEERLYIRSEGDGEYTIAEFEIYEMEGLAAFAIDPDLRPTLGRRPLGGVTENSIGSGFDITEPGKPDRWYLHFPGGPSPAWLRLPLQFSSQPYLFAAALRSEPQSGRVSIIESTPLFGDPSLEINSGQYRMWPTNINTPFNGGPAGVDSDDVITLEYDGTDATFTLNNVVTGELSISQISRNSTGVNIGTYRTADGRFLKGDLYAVVLRYDPTPPDTDVSLLSQYLRSAHAAVFRPSPALTIKNNTLFELTDFGAIQGVEVSGTTAWVTSNDGLRRFDISDPDNWLQEASVSQASLEVGFTVETFGDCHLHDGTLYIATGEYQGENSAIVIEVNPTTLEYITHHDLTQTGGGGGLNLIVRWGDNWIIGEAEFRSQFDIAAKIMLFNSDFEYVKDLFQYATDDGLATQGGALWNDYLVVGTHANQVDIFRLEVGNELTRRQSQPVPFSTQGIAVSGDQAFISRRSGGQFVALGELAEGVS